MFKLDICKIFVNNCIYMLLNISSILIVCSSSYSGDTISNILVSSCSIFKISIYFSFLVSKIDIFFLRSRFLTNFSHSEINLIYKHCQVTQNKKALYYIPNSIAKANIIMDIILYIISI